MITFVASFVAMLLALPWYLHLLLAVLTAATLREAFVAAQERSLRTDLVVITGAGSGIGRLTAHLLAKEGCRLALLDVNKEAVERVAAEINSGQIPAQLDTGAGANADSTADADSDRHDLVARAYECDITNKPEVERVAGRVHKDFGGVDPTILINNAGIVNGRGILELNPDSIMRTFQVNCISHFWTIQAFLPAMIKNDRGRVVTISSVAGLGGGPRLSDYCASKFAAVGLHECLRMELAKMGTKVRTTLVCPYIIATGMFDGASTRFPWLMPILSPEFVAQSIVSAIKRDQEWIILPSIISSGVLVKYLLPVTVADGIANLLGVSDMMNQFTGRKVNAGK